MATRATLAACLLLTGLAGAAPALAAAAVDTGEAIYRAGVVGSGAPLEGLRGADLKVSGHYAACINCHLPSGLGSVEGNVTVPPITGQYLFRPRVAGRDEPALPYVETVNTRRDAYDDATLARAIRFGINASGSPMNELMPRFAIDDKDMAALIAYLRTLDPRHVRGVDDAVLHFATIVTPDADPVKRQGMLDVLQQYVKDKNAFPFRPSPPMRTSTKTIYSKSMYMANRHWQLHVWNLTGPADTWRAQLERHLAEEPVMAVLSGLGGSDWQPVHDFCEAERVPCLFPNVEVPATGQDDFYSLYFSDGVLLEAAMIAEAIGRKERLPAGARVVQLYRAGDSGEAAGRALAGRLAARGVTVRNRALPARGRAADWRRALAGIAADDTLVLWLRPADIKGLGDLGKPPAARRIFMSGLMGGLERSPLPASWRERVDMAYPFDLPDRRVVRVDYPLGWFAFRHIPLVDEQVQADTYLACGLLAETLNHMSDVVVPEYLVERLQDTVDHRIITGYYPHLTLAIGQRFASKGGYLVRFADPQGNRIAADGNWLVP